MTAPLQSVVHNDSAATRPAYNIHLTLPLDSNSTASSLGCPPAHQPMKIAEFSLDTVPSNPENNQWYSLNGSSSVVIIFVHGYFSSSLKCWKSETGTVWPKLVLHDTRFGQPSIFMGGYYTAIDSANYQIADCADELFSAISRTSENGSPLR